MGPHETASRARPSAAASRLDHGGMRSSARLLALSDGTGMATPGQAEVGVISDACWGQGVGTVGSVGRELGQLG